LFQSLFEDICMSSKEVVDEDITNFEKDSVENTGK